MDVPPLGTRLQAHDGLDHRQRRGVGRRLAAAHLAEDRHDLGVLAQSAVLDLERPLRLLDGDVGERDGHVEEVALVERGHELAAEPREEREGRDERGKTDGDRRLGVPQSHVHERLVDSDERARDGVAMLGEYAAAHEEAHERRRERDGEQRREGHGEALRVGERLEEASRLPGEGEDGQERHRDDEEREEDGRPHLAARLDDDGETVRAGWCALEVLVRVLHEHDGRVDHGAYRDGDAAERHDVRREPEGVHGDEGEEHGHGQRQDHHQSRAHVEQEQHDDERDDDRFLDERVRERVDRAVDELRARFSARCGR